MMMRTLANGIMDAFLGTEMSAEERTQGTVEALVRAGELPECVFTYADRVAAEIEREEMEFIDDDDVIRFARQKPMQSVGDFVLNDIYCWTKIILRDRGVLKSAARSHTATKFAKVRD